MRKPTTKGTYIKVTDDERDTALYLVAREYGEVRDYVSFCFGGASYDVELRLVTAANMANIGFGAATFDTLLEALRNRSEWRLEASEHIGMTSDDFIIQPFHTASLTTVDGVTTFTAMDGNPKCSVRFTSEQIDTLVAGLEQLAAVVPAGMRRLQADIARDVAFEEKWKDYDDEKKPGIDENRARTADLITRRLWGAAFRNHYDFALAGPRKTISKDVDPAVVKIIYEALTKPL